MEGMRNLLILFFLLQYLFSHVRSESDYGFHHFFLVYNNYNYYIINNKSDKSKI
jgi:hypothetical protein